MPPWGEDPASCSAIRSTFDRPLPTLRAVRFALESLVLAGHAEAIRAGRYTYYRRALAGLTIRREECHTGQRINEVCPRDRENPLYLQLLPLRLNQPVYLAMNVKRGAAKKGQSNEAKRLVLLQTGVHLRIDPNLILISIIDSGAVLADPFDKSNVSKLILAGMPASLAKTLMTQLHRVLRRN